jgi:Tol biopolymer transport system component
MNDNLRLRSRKVLASLLLLAVILVATTLAACGGSSATTATSPSAVTSAAAGPGQSATPLPAPTVAGTIAFERVVTPGPGGNGDICVVNADGSGLTRLTDDPGREEHPSWCPRGTQSLIAYAVLPQGSDARSDATVWVMLADGSRKWQPNDAVKGAWPMFSPTSSSTSNSSSETIAVGRYRKQATGSDISLILVGWSGLPEVTRGAHYDQSPTWAAGSDLIFLRRSSELGAGDVFEVKNTLEGGEPHNLVRLTKGCNVGAFALSPDGKTMAIHNIRRDRIEIIPAQGGGPALTLLGNVSGFVGPDRFAALAWSPDGSALAVASSSDGGVHGSPLYIVNADGSGLFAVPGVGNAMDPAWRPQ